MATIEELFAKAIPKLAGVDSEKASAFRKKLGRLLAKTWCRGTSHVRASLEVDLAPEIHSAALGAAKDAAGEGSVDDFLEKVLEASDERLFVKLARATAHLAKQRAQEKEGAAPAKKTSERLKKAPSERLKKAPSERLKKAPSERLKKAPSERVKKAPSERVKKIEAKALTMSSHDDVEEVDDGPGLAVPDEPELAVPTDALDDEGPSRITIDVEEDPAAARKKLLGGDAPAAPSEDDGPDQAASRALERWRKDGDPAELETARKLYKEAVKAAKIAPARAAAKAGLALVALNGGDDAQAKRLAEEALQEDDCCPLAVAVVARATRGEGARKKLEGALARARGALARGDRKGLAAAAKELEQGWPDEPFGALVQFAETADRHEPSEAPLATAWRRYPSKNHPDLPLGAGVDLAVAKFAASWALERLEKDEPGWSRTMKDIEGKDNSVAGALQIALGVARVACATRTDLAKNEEQELRMAAANALLGLQHFDQAAATFAKARTIDRKSPAGFECSKGEDRAAVLRRAFDRPGIKAKLGTLEGVGAQALKKALSAKLEKLTSERRPLEDKLVAEETETAKKLAQDPARRSRVFERIKASGSDDPTVAQIVEAEAKLKELTSAEDGLSAKKETKPAEPPKTGLFGKLAGGLGRALDGVKDVAKGAELKMRRQLVEAKHQEALRGLGKRLRDVPDGGWKDKDLDAYVARTRTLDAKLEQLEDEGGKLGKAAARAAEF